jgi:hypothetical protein
MRSLWRLALTIAAVVGFAIPLTPPAVAEGTIAVGGGCYALAIQGNGYVHSGSGQSLQQATTDAMSQCIASARHPDTCRIIDTPYCDKPGATGNHPWIEGLRQTKIPIKWWSVLFAAAAHLLWIWHIISQKALPLPAKAGLGSGVFVIQAILAYVLGGSDGEIGLLELPIFVLPLGLGEFVASVSLRRRSA